MDTAYADSPLCARHDGALLGLFLFMSQFTFARERFPVFRLRMQQLLDAIESGIELPDTHEGFCADYVSVFERLVHALSEQDGGVNVPLFRPFVVGLGFLALAMRIPEQTDLGMLRSIMEDDWGLPMSLLDEHAAAVPEIGEATSTDDILSPALTFVREVLAPLDPEPDTCFVAMPFSEPFEEQYASVYRPMMRGVGYRTLRAWGGLGSEVHFELLTTLIDKSGALLGELTRLNPNVVFELGYGYGSGKLVIPMVDRAQPFELANLHGLAILPYDSSEPKWRESMLEGIGNMILKAFLQVANEDAPAS